MDKSVLIPGHYHPLVPSARFVNGRCFGCSKSGHIYGGYYCTACYAWFHKECADAPLRINHSSHPQHPLTLTSAICGRMCDLCGISAWFRGYGCSLCDFHLDLACASKPPPLFAIKLLQSHGHHSREEKRKVVPRCGVCKDTCEFDGRRYHVGCANLPQEVNHLSHHKHPLRLVTFKSLSNVLVKTCLLCGEAHNKMLYRCSLCNFTVCPFCGKNPPPLKIQHLKTHKHELTLWPRHISFTCNACGMQGDQGPYICFQCDFMIHRECFDLPRVININRHDHRVSLTSRVGIANSKCGVCRKSVNQYYGGYSCSTCHNYVVHSQCAIKEGVWDWKELEGTREDAYIPPYTVVGDNLIQHFSHNQHYLRLNKGNEIRDDSSRCEGCALPVYSDPIYSCERCDFMLHETCANLPMKKRLVFNNAPYTVRVEVDAKACSSCGIIFNGFIYKNRGIYDVDVSCGSFSEPFSFDGHSHSLYYKEEEGGMCVACQGTNKTMLCCDDCDYQVHLRCANLPKRVKHRSDDHHLTLCYGEDAIGKYWCDICERETDPRKWFYTCSDCGVTLHIECVLGDFSHLIPLRIMIFEWRLNFLVVPNNKSDRPFCGRCNLRCIVPFILKLCYPKKGYICSERCLYEVH